MHYRYGNFPVAESKLTKDTQPKTEDQKHGTCDGNSYS